MEGMVELAEEVLGMPARLANPESVGGLVDVVRNPKYATGVGLVLHGFRNQGPSTTGPKRRRGVWKWWDKTKEWFAEIF